MIYNLFLVGCGGFCGAALRYLVTIFFLSNVPSKFPWGTFTVNLAGCALIGWLAGLAQRQLLPEGWRLFLIPGLLGGFTTFSAFGVETFSFLRQDQVALGVSYAFLSVLAGLAFVWLGFVIGR